MWHMETSKLQLHNIPGLNFSSAKEVEFMAAPLQGSPLMFQGTVDMEDEIFQEEKIEFNAATSDGSVVFAWR